MQNMQVRSSLKYETIPIYDIIIIMIIITIIMALVFEVKLGKIFKYLLNVTNLFIFIKQYLENNNNNKIIG